MADLISIFLHIVLVSLTGYTGSAQAVFYDIGVQQLHWISTVDYTNYLGFGFASPGPQVFSLATFMGFGVAGWRGALVGTLAIYLLPILFAVIAGKYLEKWLLKKHFVYFIKIIGLAAAGVLFFIGVNILSKNHISFLYVLIAVAATFAAIKKVNSFLIIVAGLLLGLGLS